MKKVLLIFLMLSMVVFADNKILEDLKGKKVTFQVVDAFPDLKVEFVKAFGDYKVTVSESKAFSEKTIKVKIVTAFPDVKLQKVGAFGDFEIVFE